MKRFLIVAWGAGLSSFFMAGVFGRGFFMVGFGIGLFNSITAPVPEFFGKNSLKTVNQFVYFFLNIIFALALTYLIALAWQYFYENVVDWGMEPISFGLIYGVLHMIITFPLSKLYKYIKK